MSQGYVTLDSIIRSACEERDDLNLKKYRKFEMWALESLQELSMDACQEIKTLKQTIDPYTCAVPFPKDMAKWIKLGEKKGDRLRVFSVNNRLLMVNDTDDCGQPIRNAKYKPNYSPLGFALGGDEDGDNGGFWFYNYGYYGDTSGAIYGFGGGAQEDGQFRVDRENRRFVFASHFANKDIYIEYVTNGIDPTAGSLVPMVIQKAVKYYILWRDANSDPSRGLGERETAKMEYYNEERWAARRVSPMTADKVIEIWRGRIMQTPNN